MSKLYVRQGRRFVPVPDCTGYFYDRNGLHKEKTEDSFAIVVSQNGDIATLASLEQSSERMTWEEAKDCCNHLWIPLYLPSLIEMLEAMKFKEHLHFELEGSEWTSTEYSTYRAWYLHWNSYEGVGVDGKLSGCYVRPFFKLNVLTGEYV